MYHSELYNRIILSTGEKTPIEKRSITFFSPQMMFWQQWRLRRFITLRHQMHIWLFWTDCCPVPACSIFVKHTRKQLLFSCYINSLGILASIVSHMHHSASSSLIWGFLQWLSPICSLRTHGDSVKALYSSACQTYVTDMTSRWRKMEKCSQDADSLSHSMGGSSSRKSRMVSFPASSYISVGFWSVARD